VLRGDGMMGWWEAAEGGRSLAGGNTTRAAGLFDARTPSARHFSRFCWPDARTTAPISLFRTEIEATDQLQQRLVRCLETPKVIHSKSPDHLFASRRLFARTLRR
jgi:hypothetical protein